MTFDHTYFYIVVHTQGGCHTIKLKQILKFNVLLFKLKNEHCFAVGYMK
jgi:hypothetical protein